MEVGLIRLAVLVPGFGTTLANRLADCFHRLDLHREMVEARPAGSIQEPVEIRIRAARRHQLPANLRRTRNRERRAEKTVTLVGAHQPQPKHSL